MTIPLPKGRRAMKDAPREREIAAPTKLTHARRTCLIMVLMSFAKPILVAMLGFAFAAYGFDCSPMMATDNAMECCDSMNCSDGMHGEDCCQTGPSMHAPFVQPASVHTIALTPLASTVLPAPLYFLSIDHANGCGVLRLHGPPSFGSSTPPLQLRI